MRKLNMLVFDKSFLKGSDGFLFENRKGVKENHFYKSS